MLRQLLQLILARRNTINLEKRSILMSVEKAESNNPIVINRRLIFRYLPIPYLETYVPRGIINATEVIKKTRLIAFSISTFKCKSETALKELVERLKKVA